MKLWTMTWMAFVMMFCFAVAAYADPVSEDKTEMAKTQAIAEAEDKLQPLANKVKDQFDEVLKDRKLGYQEMRRLETVIVNYQRELGIVNKHLTVYNASLTSKAYQPAVKLTKLYFTIFFLSDGRHHQKEMRLLAAKEGVDLQDIQVNFSIFFFLLLIGGCLAIIVGFEEDSIPATLWGVAFLAMGLFALFYL